jgi:hypothetical protein
MGVGAGERVARLAIPGIHANLILTSLRWRLSTD